MSEIQYPAIVEQLIDEHGRKSVIELFDAAFAYEQGSNVAEIERLRRDAERMDWMQRNECTSGVEFDADDCPAGWRVEYPGGEVTAATLRDAIDAAMAAKGDGDE